MSLSDDYYAALEIPRGASKQEVKRAFRELAKAYHPDLYPYDDVSRRNCERKMAELNAAYDFLKEFAPDEAPPPEPRPAPPDPESPEEDPEPDLAAKYGAHAADEPWPEPEPFVEGEPVLTRWDPEAARRAEWTKPGPWSPLRHRMPQDEPDFPGLTQTGGSFSAAILVLLGLYVVDMTRVNDYFSLLRVVVCLSCAHGAYFSLCRGYWEIAMACAVLAVALNPAVPLLMSLEAWWVFNGLCAVMLIFFWVVMFNRESDKALGIRRRG